MRYGDDAIFLAESRSKIEQIRKEAGFFLKNELGLTINPKNDIIVPVKRGIKFLGCWVYPSGICLVSRTRKKMADSLSLMNISSYSGLVIKQESRKMKNNFEWKVRELL
jgi:hypothetical protein